MTAIADAGSTLPDFPAWAWVLLPLAVLVAAIVTDLRHPTNAAPTEMEHTTAARANHNEETP